MKDSALLVVLSGNPQMLAAHLGVRFPGALIGTAVVDEKMIARYRSMYSLLRKGTYSAVCFGTKELELQRYQVALKFYLLAVPAKQRLILDEAGNAGAVSLVPYLVQDIPKFIFEMFASVIVLIRSYNRLVLLRRSVGRN